VTAAAVAAPVRPARIATPDAVVDRRADGTTYVRSRQALGSYSATLTDRLAHWAAEAPDRTFLARRGADGDWRRLTYADALLRARRVAQALVERGLSAERPVAILSGNGIEHAVLALGAMYAGVPYAPVAPASALASRDQATLRHVLDLLRPGVVFAAEGEAFAHVLPNVHPDAEVVVADGSAARLGATPFDALEATAAGDAAEAARAATGPDTVAKVLFTSGSTGRPKGVITTQRMLCANQEMLRTVMTFLAAEPPVLCDWLPWNHVFGGSHNFGIALYNGGTLYIDDGRPTPAGIAETVRNLREVASTAYFNVPRGYEMLVPHLRADAALRERFFSRVEILFYAAAGLGQRFWDELQALAVEACGERIRMVTGLGATESAPFALCVASDDARAGMVGLPVPGVELKLVPNGAKLEARLRGPNVTPGFWGDHDRTRAAFDDEGFYRLGDALVWVDPDDPAKGLAFDGRLDEDFKLSTGTWVSVGPLRARLLGHLAPYAQDVVIAGHDREAAAALVFPNVAACRALCPERPADSPSALLGRAEVRETFARLLGDAAAQATGSSTCVDRAILLDEPPSLDALEITDKGSINQRAVLRHRAALVEELYAAAPGPRVIRAAHV
jgi:feruloyl-CoA synthase